MVRALVVCLSLLSSLAAADISPPEARRERGEDDRCGVLPSLGDGFLYGDSDGCPDVVVARGDRSTLDPGDVDLLARLLVELRRRPRLTRLEIRGSPKSVAAVRHWLIARGIAPRRIPGVFEAEAWGAWLNPTEWDGRPLPYR